MGRGKKRDTREGGEERSIRSDPLSAFPRSCRTRRPVIVITGETFREKPFVLFLFLFLLFLFFFCMYHFASARTKIPSDNCENSRRGAASVKIGVIKLPVIFPPPPFLSLSLSFSPFFFLSRSLTRWSVSERKRSTVQIGRICSISTGENGRIRIPRGRKGKGSTRRSGFRIGSVNQYRSTLLPVIGSRLGNNVTTA